MLFGLNFYKFLISLWNTNLELIMLLLMLWVKDTYYLLICKWKWRVLKCWKISISIIVILARYGLIVKMVFPSILLCSLKETECVFLKVYWGKPLSLKLITMGLMDILREIKKICYSGFFLIFVVNRERCHKVYTTL